MIEFTFISCRYPASLSFSVWPPFTVAAEMERNATVTQHKITKSFILSCYVTLDQAILIAALF